MGEDRPMCWKYDKRGVPHLKDHKWVEIETPDPWEWEECRGCGQLRRQG